MCQQDCILSHNLYNLHAEYIMRNARLQQIVTGIKIAERNMNRYAGITTLMSGSEEYLWKEKQMLLFNILKS